jgi:methionyl-tRNA formyltransferase
LHDKLANIGAEAIIEVLGQFESGKIYPDPQDDQNATYAAKITKEESHIDWSLSAEEIERKVRSYNPYPGSSTAIHETPIKIWQASIGKETQGEPGMVIKILKNSLVVACGRGSLGVEVLQKPNAKALPVDQFLQGFNIKAGDRFKTA